MPQYVKRYPKALPASLCRRLIERFNLETNLKRDPQPLYSTRKYFNISLGPNWRDLDTDVLRYSNQLMHRYFNKPGCVPSDVPDKWGNDGFVMACYSIGNICTLHFDGQSGYPPHNNLRVATQLFYLNDVEIGGETHFPLQKLKIKPEEGKCIVFPVSFAYPHEVLKATVPRYVLQTWITDPDYFVFHSSLVDTSFKLKS